jgi:thiamine-monophosphate kinase
MIDLSDGLGADAAHLAAASGVALALELDLVPVAPAAVAESRQLCIAPEQFAAEGGEEYELLVALPEGFTAEDALAFERACGIELTRVGRAREGAGVHARLAGSPVALSGCDHFAAVRR